MKILVIMDPVESIDPEVDSTYGICLNACQRGYELAYAEIEDISLKDEKVFGRVRPILFQKNAPHFSFSGEPEEKALNSFDYILMRKDPPFDEKFIFATHLLSFCEKGKVINDPEGILNSPEKLYAYRFPGIFPKSLISHRLGEIREFVKECGGKAVLKPLNGNGGAGIFLLQNEDPNFNSTWEILSEEGKKPLVVQEFLPEVEQGDMRVICVAGEPEGMLVRIPPKNQIRANIHVGGSTKLSGELTPRAKWLCDQVKDQLVRDGLYFVGLDIIGDYITEINVTSPTGIREVLKYGGKDIAQIFWDRIHTFSESFKKSN